MTPARDKSGSYWQINGSGPLVEIDWHWEGSPQVPLVIIDFIWQSGLPFQLTFDQRAEVVAWIYANEPS